MTEVEYTLKYGPHQSPEDGMCAMEWVAYLAGEPHSDKPDCVDPPLRRFSIGLNDSLPDDLRQRLRPYLARCIGTANDGRTEERRWMMADFAVRVAAAEAQEVMGPRDHAEKLRSLPPITDAKSGRHAAEVCRQVGAYSAAYAAAAANAAYAAANAAYDADAAYDAAAAAAAAANAAANAAYDADAADAAAAATARRSMWGKLMPSIEALYDRMLPTEVVELPEQAQAEYEELLAQ